MQQALTFGDTRAGYPDRPAASPDDTSQQAAEDIAPKAFSIRARVWACIKHEPVTVHECAGRLNLPVSTVQPRFSELRKMGMIEDDGVRRLNPTSGKQAIVWHPTADINAGVPKAYRDIIAREEARRQARARGESV